MSEGRDNLRSQSEGNVKVDTITIPKTQKLQLQPLPKSDRIEESDRIAV